MSACATATRDQVAPVVVPPSTTTTPSGAAPGEPVISMIDPYAIDITALPPGAPAPLQPDQYAPHIALILPLNSPSFAPHAMAVQQGFLAAAGSQARSFPVRVYSSADEGKEAIDIYRQAQANGAVAVAGPLTRSGVALLAGYTNITLPTLALNTTDSKPESDKLYFFGLIPETEARQAAQLAFAANLRDATIINTGTALSKRLVLAFEDEWKKLGGNITAEVTYKEGDDASVLLNLPVAPWLVEPEPVPPITVISETGEVSTTTPKRTGPPPLAPGNIVFLAGDNKQARLIRPYLNPSLPVYATSQLFNMHADTLTNYDLNEIHFVDMPWLLQPDHPAVMIYPRSDTSYDTDKERLYAFGIDAYRLLQMLLNDKLRSSLPMDGVTGRIHLAEPNLFQRDAITATFRYGRGLTPEGLAAVEAERAAAKAAEIAARRAAENATPAP
ncbi:MAG TPA: penicillin-binding protein activator [Gallionellaceae bacterium]|nr:penicillin-binding protein activator [Gallionellaceae bacterium]HQS75565.1 penicillin-binding protein activator [Gallionellaceae bacterium]